MINDFRKLIQAELNKIDGLTSSKIISDDAIQVGEYNYGYEVATSVMNSNVDYSNNNMVLNVTGYLTTKGEELSKFDEYTDSICQALANLHIKATTKDITTYDTTRKTLITGSVIYNSLDKLLR